MREVSYFCESYQCSSRMLSHTNQRGMKEHTSGREQHESETTAGHIGHRIVSWVL